jgi:hypothetical protein
VENAILTHCGGRITVNAILRRRNLAEAVSFMMRAVPVSLTHPIKQNRMGEAMGLSFINLRNST